MLKVKSNQIGKVLPRFFIVTSIRENVMNYDKAYALLQQKHQMQLLKYYDELDEAAKARLLADIERIDFSIIEDISHVGNKTLGELSPIDALSLKQMDEGREHFKEIGKKALLRGEVGAVLLAGGMGTRLGCEGAKGVYNMGETREISIFELQMRNINDVVKECGVYFPLFIMTSDKTDEMTRAFFKEHNYFGYDSSSIYFYKQKVAAACSFDGEIFLEERDKVFFSPNGNGGWYNSLVTSGLKSVIDRLGVKWLNVYAVDNVLQRICDTAFIGATIESGCACSAKVVKKACPEEKVGVLCKENGVPTIVEYYEMPPELAAEKDNDGELKYRYGVILNYLFSVDRLNVTIEEPLPYHKATKVIPHIEDGVKVTPDKPNGYKFEKLAVDLVKVMGNCLAVEVDRNKEFAPVKNKEGVDSVVSARKLLKLNGVEL